MNDAKLLLGYTRTKNSPMARTQPHKVLLTKKRKGDLHDCLVFLRCNPPPPPPKKKKAMAFREVRRSEIIINVQSWQVVDLKSPLKNMPQNIIISLHHDKVSSSNMLNKGYSEN